jgi:hypothetical protein
LFDLNQLFAQVDRDKLMTQMSKEACDALAKVDLSDAPADQLKVSLGLALLAAAGKHQAELTQLRLSLADPQAGQNLGTEIGVRLAGICPSFIAAMANNSAVVKDMTARVATRVDSAQAISGTLLKIVEGEFTYLQVEDSKGKIEKLWWMDCPK